METTDHVTTRRTWRRRALWAVAVWIVALIAFAQYGGGSDGDQVSSTGDERVDALTAELCDALIAYMATDVDLSNAELLAEDRRLMDELVAVYDEWSAAIEESDDVEYSLEVFSDAVGELIDVIELSAAEMERCVGDDTDDASFERCALWSMQRYMSEIRGATEDAVDAIPDDLDTR